MFHNLIYRGNTDGNDIIMFVMKEYSPLQMNLLAVTRVTEKKIRSFDPPKKMHNFRIPNSLRKSCGFH